MFYLSVSVSDESVSGFIDTTANFSGSTFHQVFTKTFQTTLGLPGSVALQTHETSISLTVFNCSLVVDIFRVPINKGLKGSLLWNINYGDLLHLDQGRSEGRNDGRLLMLLSFFN